MSLGLSERYDAAHSGFVIYYPKETLQKTVIPAKAGIQVFESRGKSTAFWIPAFAGMTRAGLLQSIPNYKFINSHQLAHLKNWASHNEKGPWNIHGPFSLRA